jgi:hypothetical protein
MELRRGLPVLSGDSFFAEAIRMRAGPFYRLSA